MIILKRFWIALSLLAIIISLCISEQVLIDNITNDLNDCLESSAKNLKDKNYENLCSSNDLLLDKWENYERILSMFMQHDDLSDLEESILILKPNIECEDYDQLFVELEKAKFELENLKNSETPVIYNIL